MLQIYYQVFRLLFNSEDIIVSDLTTYTAQNFKKFLRANFLEKKWSSSTYNFYRKYLNVYCSFLVKE
jgi:hypothetical protein